jgi:cytochrome c oxidase assembly factor CtaG
MATVEGSPGPADAHGPKWRARERHWLTASAVAVLVACLVPPVTTLARRYVFVESIQFALFAMAVPAMVVLGAPWRLLRLSRGTPGVANPPGVANRPGVANPPGVADRLAVARRRHPSIAGSMAFLVLFAGVSLIWRLPTVVNALAGNEALTVLEMASLLVAGTGLWLEIATSPPLMPRGAGPQRAVIAALAMWFIWIMAYILGFATDAVFHAYSRAGGGLGPVTDQALATWSMWLVAGLCFAPVVFIATLGWLRDGEHPDAELERVADEVGLPAVRGWGHPRRRNTSRA